MTFVILKLTKVTLIKYINQVAYRNEIDMWQGKEYI